MPRKNKHNPPGSKQNAQSSGSKQNAQPSGSKQNAQPSGSKQGAQPSGSKQGAQPSGSRHMPKIVTKTTTRVVQTKNESATKMAAPPKESSDPSKKPLAGTVCHLAPAGTTYATIKEAGTSFLEHDSIGFLSGGKSAVLPQLFNNRYPHSKLLAICLPVLGVGALFWKGGG